MREASQTNATLEKIKNSLTIKTLIIGFIIISMIVPSIMVFILIQERQSRQDCVVEEIGSKWGRAQTVVGPLISIPYKHVYQDKNDKKIESTNYEHFLPEELNVEVKLMPEIRQRGIFEAVVYNANVKITGYFNPPKPSETPEGKAIVSLGIDDMKGITEKISAEFSGQKLEFIPGVDSNDVISKGVSAKIELPSDNLSKIPFKIMLSLNGSKEFNIVPVGKTSIMKMKSEWPSPSFDGAFLPSSRTTNKDGFSAEWKIIELNRSFPQTWKNNKYNIYESSFGARLIIEANVYQQATRTAKYAMLFVVFTFASIFISELITKSRIHPLQYLLIGLAIILFYCLLLAIAEQIGFGIAYLISASAIILIISLYSKSAFSKTSLAFIIATVLTVIYGYFYIILQIEDYALLMGSIGLFFILSLVMYMTRKINSSNDEFKQ